VTGSVGVGPPVLWVWVGKGLQDSQVSLTGHRGLLMAYHDFGC